MISCAVKFICCLALLVGAFACDVQYGPNVNERLPELVGHNVDQVTGKFGEPVAIHDVLPAEGLSEFHCEIWNTYPIDDPATASVTIREFVWVYETYRVAVWFHLVNEEWVVLDGIRWGNNVNF